MMVKTAQKWNSFDYKTPYFVYIQKMFVVKLCYKLLNVAEFVAEFVDISNHWYH